MIRTVRLLRWPVHTTGTDDMSDYRVTPSWATPIAPQFDPPFFARFFRHVTARTDCLARRQGRCPGKALCHDCEWREGRQIGE